MIEITEPAVAKITDIMSEENNPALKLRVFVQGGGCSGFSYGFTLDEEVAEELALPPVKIHCSILAEDAIKAAVEDYRLKH